MKLQLQHHFSETRHLHGQNDTNFNLLYLRLGYRQNFLGLATALLYVCQTKTKTFWNYFARHRYV